MAWRPRDGLTVTIVLLAVLSVAAPAGVTAWSDDAASTTETAPTASVAGTANEVRAGVSSFGAAASPAGNSQGNFSVTGVESNVSTVLEGETLDVTANVTNVGDRDTNQTINLSINGSQKDSQELTVTASESKNVTLSWVTENGDAGNYSATINSENGSDDTTVSVQEPANFSVNLSTTNSPVTEGENLTVNATINNTGDITGEQDVNLTISGSEEDVVGPLTLNAGESATETFVWETIAGDNCTCKAVVNSANATDSANVTVQTPANFTVTIDDTNSPVVTGETLQVTATINNTGDVEENRMVRLDLNDSDLKNVDNESVTLGGGNQTVITLNWTTKDGDGGDYNATVSTANDTDHATIQIDEDAGGGGGGGGFYPPPSDGGDGPNTDFVLTTLALGPTEVGVDEGVTVDVRVDNDGEDDGEFTGTLTVDGESVADRTVPVNGNWHETFAFSTAFDQPGTYRLAVNGETAGTVTVTGDADILVSDVQIDATEVRAGETVTATTTVTNEGTVEGSREIALRIGGETATSRSVTLGPGESRTVAFEHTFSAAGSHDVALGSERVETVDVAESQATGGTGGTYGDDGNTFGGFSVLPLVAMLGVLIATLSFLGYGYSEEISDLIEE